MPHVVLPGQSETASSVISRSALGGREMFRRRGLGQTSDDSVDKPTYLLIGQKSSLATTSLFADNQRQCSRKDPSTE